MQSSRPRTKDGTATKGIGWWDDRLLMRVDLAAASDVATAAAGSKEGSGGAGLGGGGGEGSGDDGGVDGPKFGGDEGHCAMEPDTMRTKPSGQIKCSQK